MTDKERGGPLATAEDRAAVRAATIGAGAFVAVQVAGKATRDALFLSTFPVSYLPAAMMASSAASLVAVLGLSRALAARPPARLVPLLSAGAAVLLIAEWALALVSPAAAAVAVYLHLAFFGATLVSGFWSVVNEHFDPYTAKRVVGRIGLGSAVGGVAGGAIASVLAGVLPVAALLVVCAVFNALGVYALLQLRRPEPASSPAEASDPPPSGMAVLRRVGYLRDLAAIVGVSAATEALLDYALGAAAVASFGSGQALLSFFALYQTAVATAGLVAQVVLTRFALREVGLAGTVASQPLAVLAGGALAALDPRLLTVALVRGAEASLHNSLFRSAYELLYTPLPASDKRPTKALVDVGFDKLGAFAGSWLTLGLVAIVPDQATRLAVAISAAASIVVLLVCRRVHAGYVDALEESLRSGVVRLDSSDVQDSTTHLAILRTTTGIERSAVLRELGKPVPGAARPPEIADPLMADVAALRTGRADQVRRVLRAREDLPPALVAHLVPLLSRNELFLDILRALRRAAPRVTGQLVDALLDPDLDPAARRRLPRVLRACPTPRAAAGLLAALSDARLDVRMAAGQALARMCDQQPGLAPPRETAFALARRELGAGGAIFAPQSGAETMPVGHGLDRGLEHVFTLLSLAIDREAMQSSLLALRGGDARLRGTALEWLDNVLPDGLRAELWPHLKATPPLRTGRPENEVRQDLLQSSLLLRTQRRRAEG